MGGDSSASISNSEVYGKFMAMMVMKVHLQQFWPMEVLYPGAIQILEVTTLQSKTSSRMFSQFMPLAVQMEAL